MRGHTEERHIGERHTERYKGRGHTKERHIEKEYTRGGDIRKRDI